MRKTLLFILFALTTALPAWSGESGAFQESCALAGATGQESSRQCRQQADEAPGSIFLAEMRDDGDHITYESIPENNGFPNLQDEERAKQEKAWQMLQNSLIIAPRDRRLRPHSNSGAGDQN